MIQIAVIGAGVISGVYLRNIAALCPGARVLGLCDLDRERAQRLAVEFGVPRVYACLEEALGDPEVKLVLNLTRPTEHYAVSRSALLAGKHVYSEKPLGVTIDEAHQLVQLAKARSRALGCAPDTFLGSGLQTCRKLLDGGYIGEVVAASCSMMCHGHESWHPDPAFYYQPGGGPMMDMGPYYVTALIYLLGEVAGVTGACVRGMNTRRIECGPHRGKAFAVNVMTHQTGTLHFHSGALATLCTSFDAHFAPENQSRFEIYGTKGTLLVPDPNTFGGPVRLYRPEDQPRREALDPGQLHSADAPLGFKEIPLLFPHSVNSRGLGLADLCDSIQNGGVPRASGEQAEHALEVIDAINRSSTTKQYCPVKSGYARPEPMPLDGKLA